MMALSSPSARYCSVSKNISLILIFYSFLIQMDQRYINKKKSEEKPIMFFEFLITIRKKLELMIKGLDIVGRDTKWWQDTLLEVL